MSKTYKFDAKLSGDGECFAFEISKEDYINIFGMNEYNKEIELIKDINDSYKEDFKDDIESIKQYLKDENPETFLVYPRSLFGREYEYDGKYNISLTFKKANE